MRLLLILTALLGSVLGADLIVESLLETINKTSNPCDDFYRHACPLGTKTEHVNEKVQKSLKKLDGIWNHIEIMNDRKDKELNLTSTVPKFFVKLCESGNSTDHLLTELGKIMNRNLMFFKKDADCVRVGDGLRRSIFNYLETKDKPNKLQIHLKSFEKSLKYHFYHMVAIPIHLDNDLESGVENIRDMVETMKTKIDKMIMETPWTNNHNVTEFNREIAKLTTLEVEYSKLLKDSFNHLMKFELLYRKCKQEFQFQEEAHFLCFVRARSHFVEVPLPEGPRLFAPMNAMNMFPELGFGVYFYYLAKHSETMATKLGAVTFVIGHELAHTMIKSINDPTQTYFSQEALDCTQNQFNSTCNEFKEESCDADEIQYDENGADILGLQLAYSMLEDHYGERLKENYAPLNVTYQQLFFYSVVPFFCYSEPSKTYYYEYEGEKIKDVHSADNIRVNVIANNPGFKDAFQCPDNSRMMKSATKQCHFYGKDAPLHKRL